MKEDIWHPIPQYPKYRITKCGKVYSVRYKKEMKLHKNTKGYVRVQLRNGRGAKMFFVHRLVWKTFKGRIRKGYDIDHHNHIRHDNRLANLRHMSHKRNCHKMLKNSPHVLNNLKNVSVP